MICNSLVGKREAWRAEKCNIKSHLGESIVGQAAARLQVPEVPISLLRLCFGPLLPHPRQ